MLRQSTGMRLSAELTLDTFTCTISHNRSGNVPLVILHAKQDVGVKGHKIAKSFPKLTAAHNVTRVDVTDLNLVSAVIFHALGVALDQRKVIVWYVFSLFFFVLHIKLLTRFHFLFTLLISFSVQHINSLYDLFSTKKAIKIR